MSARPYSLAVLAAAAMAAPVSAGTVNLHFDTTTSSSAVSVAYKVGGGAATPASGVPGPYYWHQDTTSMPLNAALPASVATFCVDLAQHISTGNTYSYTSYTPIGSTPGVNATEAKLISQLYATDYNLAWNKSTFAGDDSSTAFQLALWELVYDSGSGLSLSDKTSNFYVASGGASTNAVSIAQGYLDVLKAGNGKNLAPNAQLVWLASPSSQDQIVYIPGNPVPAPAGAVLLGFGGLLAAARNLRRKVAAPTTAA